MKSAQNIQPKIVPLGNLDTLTKAHGLEGRVGVHKVESKEADDVSKQL